MFHPLTWVAMVAAIVSHTLAAILFKTSAQQKRGRRVVLFFVLGNAAGFFNPLCTTIAMKGNDANLVMATMAAFGGMFFVLTLNRVFKERLTSRQWLAIGIILLATLMLQLDPYASDKPMQDRGAQQKQYDIYREGRTS